MRRRAGFTLVEVLVAMALILFIMTILATSFGAATQAVGDLKSAGDLAERLRGATMVIKRDLEATHVYRNGVAQRISTLYGTAANPNGPPDQGYLRIYEQTPDVDEGPDLDGIHSYHQTTASLAYTISLTGTRRNDFLSAYVPGSPLCATNDPVLLPPDQRYEDTPSTAAPQVYSSQCAEVALFLVQETDVTDASTGPAQPLFSLMRRQLLTTPPYPSATNDWSPAPPVAAGNAPLYVEVSTIPTAGEASAAPNLSFNSLADLTIPPKRFWMNRANLAGAYQQTPSGTFNYATLAQCNASYQNADLLISDVLSMDVRILLQGDFRELANPVVQSYSGGNPAYPIGGPWAFDTWSSATDPNNATYNYATPIWQTPGTPASIPLYQGTNAAPISIQAIQITLRVWDFKTKKTRQVTIVQQM